MPAAVAVPIIAAALPAAGQAGAAFMNSRAAGKAAKLEHQGAEDALAYQRERQAVEDARYNQRWNSYQDYVKDWKARNGYGSPAPAAGSSLGVAPGMTLADLGGAPGQAGAAQGAPGSTPTLADVSKWNDWRQYGTA